MSVRAANEWKVGAFVVGGVVLLIVALFWLGASRFDKNVIERVTYFDESVQGLEVGAPIKVRGVTIGKVAAIRLAPDRRLVEVRAEIWVDSLVSINALESPADAGPDGEAAPPEMRMIIASQGITGIKFLEADFFSATTPKIELSFKAPENYIPSAPSTLKSVEDAVRGLGEELPLALREFRRLVATLDEQVTGLDTRQLSSSISGLADQLRGTLDGTATTGLGADVSGLVGDLRRTVGMLAQALGELTGPEGSLEETLVSVRSVAAEAGTAISTLESILTDADIPATAASLRGATDSTARLAQDLAPAAHQMSGAVQDLRRTLRRIESLADLLERDPGALLRGRSAPSK